MNSYNGSPPFSTMPNIQRYRHDFIQAFLYWSLIIVTFVACALLWIYLQEPQWTTGVLLLTFAQFPPVGLWCLWLLRQQKTEQIIWFYLVSGLIACTAFVIFMPDLFLLVGVIGYILFVRITIFLESQQVSIIMSIVCLILYGLAVLVHTSFALPPLSFFGFTTPLLYILPILTLFLFNTLDRLGTRYLRDALQSSEYARSILSESNDKLREKTEQLEQSQRRLSELAEKLESNNQELTVVNEELKSFAYIISHDLRAPLVNLKGFAGELHLAFETVEPVARQCLASLSADQQHTLRVALDEEIPEALGFIDSAVTRMSSFINALLLLSRYGRREMHFETIDLAQIVQITLQSLAHQITEKQINVQVTTLPEITADFVSMEQIMTNLLSNAINYLSPKRPGEIKIYAQENERETKIVVQDNGRGIAPHNMHKLFEPFRRIHNDTIPGEGMGLAYVNTLVRRHNGRIWCESETDIGSRFIFTIAKNLNKEGN